MDDSHEIDVRKFYPALFDLLIQNLAETRALAGALSNVVSKNTGVDVKVIAELMEAQTNEQKKLISNLLFENYGYLPDDILGGAF